MCQVLLKYQQNYPQLYAQNTPPESNSYCMKPDFLIFFYQNILTDWVQKQIKILLFFLTTYLCEAWFSLYISIKTTYCNRLNAEDLKIQLSSVKPNLKRFAKVKTMSPFSLIFWGESARTSHMKDIFVNMERAYYCYL